MNTQVVQGDLFFIRKIVIPKGAKTVERTAKGYIIAEGEATGHAHVIDDDIRLYEKDGTLYVTTSKTVEVRHEEHRPVSLEAGVWQVGIVREYDPFLEETRSVAD